ncbi:MAG: sirohydrochlorin cobaltochelatase [Deferribacteraceae bacterium]|jgi:sirohydrochlorin cobaltochelatase|nr:sirohydrochlorin cobaltochelatase [Deferribacteraceae bacterium]
MKAIILAVFGTSTEAAVTFDELVPALKANFPDRAIFVPYTSGMIRRKLNANLPESEQILSPEAMLDKLKYDGYHDIIVLTTLLFAGVEHDKLKLTVDSFAEANPNIRLRYQPPLLADAEKLPMVVEMLAKYMLTDGINIVVAHGTSAKHPAEAVYMKLAELVAAKYPNARVASIEGEPDMEAALDFAKAQQANDVRAIVFMFVAGEHAANDIMGENDSLFAAIRSMGKRPSVAYNGERVASLGLDADYRKLLLDWYNELS